MMIKKLYDKKTRSYVILQTTLSLDIDKLEEGFIHGKIGSLILKA